MKISYDKEVDALYIRLLEGEYQCRTVHLSDEIAINLGPHDELVGIEVLDAKEVLGKGNLPQIVMENVPKDWILAA
jgi:uncharacterized protein YuzE